VTRRTRIVLKSAVWAVCLTPLARLLWRAWGGDLTADPIAFITTTLGQWTLRFLLASLALTPLRILIGRSWPIAFRRLLGLFAFFYASLHFGVWIVLDHFFAWREMGADIVKRPFITAGVTALVLLTPLAATSTAGMIRRLGGKNWSRLHRLVYVAAIVASFHFIWLAKVGRVEPYVYASVLALLLSVRVVDALKRRVARATLAATVRPARPPA
jgi:methionine sulfoxide reductase heme-binding subunit